MKNIFNKSKSKNHQQEQTPAVTTTTNDLIIHALQLPVFGNTFYENFNEFFENFESMTSTLNNEIKAQLLLFRLHGNAAQIVKPYLQQTLPYSDLVIILQKHCNGQLKLEMDLTTFTANIRQNINKQYPNSSGNNEKSREKLMIKEFLTGMPSDLKQQLQPNINHFQTLQQLLDYVTSMRTSNFSR